MVVVTKIRTCLGGVLMKEKECLEKFVDLHNEFLEALEVYIQVTGSSLEEISKKTTLSIRTIIRFLKNTCLSETSYRKLLRLGDEYYKVAASSLAKSIAIMESKTKSRAMMMSLHPYGCCFKV